MLDDKLVIIGLICPLKNFLDTNNNVIKIYENCRRCL